MIDASKSAVRRRFYLSQALRKRPIGAGSDLEFLMELPRAILPVDVGELLRGESWCAIGAVAARAYMPERSTKDIDILVAHERRERIRRAFIADGWKQGPQLEFFGSSLGLSGSTFMKDTVEVDIISSDQPWAANALETPNHDQTGIRVIALPYLVLMKLDAARAIDQGDLSRMLGRVDDKRLEEIVAVVKKYMNEPDIERDIRQYAELGRLERMRAPEDRKGRER